MEDATELALDRLLCLEIIGIKRSYTLKWCKPINDDDNDDDVKGSGMCCAVLGSLIVLWFLFHLLLKHGSITHQSNHLRGPEVCLPTFHRDFCQHRKYRW